MKKILEYVAILSGCLALTSGFAIDSSAVKQTAVGGLERLVSSVSYKIEANVGQYGNVYVDKGMQIPVGNQSCDLKTHHYTIDTKLIDTGYAANGDFNTQGLCRLLYTYTYVDPKSIVVGKNMVKADLQIGHDVNGEANFIFGHDHRCSHTGNVGDNFYYARLNLYCTPN